MKHTLIILMTMAVAFAAIFGATSQNAFAVTIERRVATGNDDSEENGNTGSISLTSSDLEMVWEWPDNNQWIGIRFTDVNIPQGADITNAYVQFKVDEVTTGDCNLTIWGEDVDNASQLTTGTNDISSRTRTTASVGWEPNIWDTAGEEGVNQRTPDISSAIEEVVGRGGWSYGNALVVVLTGTGERTAESYNGDSAGAPLLHVEYTTGPATYTLTVNSGSGDGDYEANTVVQILADPPDANSLFDVWTGDTANIDDVSESNTTITMPAADTEVTATYKEKPTYHLTVNSGSGDGNYYANEVEQILADPPDANSLFDVWTGDTANIADTSEPNTTITMPAAATEVTATYVEKPTYTLTVNSGDGDGDYEASTVVDITADPPPDGNQIFDIWTGDTANIDDTSEANTTITMPAAATEVTATYVEKPTYHLTVNSGSGDGNYYADEVASITADPPDANSLFDVWTGDTANIADVSQSSTTITMPAAATEVTATYVEKPTYHLTVNSGAGDGNYYANEMEQILADAPGEGQIFDVWTGDTANIDDTGEANTTITMPVADTEVTATYTDDPTTYQLTVNSGSGDGYYDPTTVVQILADAPPDGNQLFDVWTGDTDNIADTSEPNTTITMPAADSEITATYKEQPTYHLTVNSGSGDGNYYANEVEQILADAPGEGQVFDVWTGDTANVDDTSEANTTITMPAANAEVTATYAAAGGDSIERRVATGNDDAEEDGTDGSISLTSSDLELVYAFPDDQVIGIRFTDVNIPQGADVTTAYIQFKVDEVSTGDCNLTIESEDVDNASQFTTDTNNISQRTRTSASTYWEPNIWDTVGEAGVNQRTPDISSVIEEVVGRGGWSYGNALVLIITGTGTRVAESYNGDSAGAPLLHVEYGGGAPSYYLLTVNSGDGDGNYQASTVVDITADPPPDGNQIFDVWTGDTANIADTSEPNTTITMPAADTEITATYKLKDFYTLTVNSGSGDGNYTANTVVDILADDPPTGDIFDVWTGDTDNVDDTSEANTTITMPAANTEITATYKDDPNTFQLTVNSGSGDGLYEANAVVDILADSPGVVQLFDVWTGDTDNVDDTSEANTTIEMPAADSEITATYKNDPNYVAPSRGYTSRACGFDMNHNGTIGEAADKTVGDGNTTDPDGDGTDEDLIYVSAADGNDNTGDGSASNPYKTVQKALDVADGPGDGAEDIVCVAGTFDETLTIKQSGVGGYYTRDNFQFPNNPAMLIGWDTDKDGEYPPHDTDDEAVFDGNTDGSPRAWAIAEVYPTKISYVEIAHLTIKGYGYQASDCGAMKLFSAGDANQTHVYVHDVEMYDINKAVEDHSTRIVLSFWGGPRLHVAVINCLVDGYASYFCRGSPSSPSGNFRFQNITLKMYGLTGTETNHHSMGWKLWETHNNVEIIDNIIDAQPDLYNATLRNYGMTIAQCAQDYTIRNNEFIDCRRSVGLQGDAGSNFCQSRPVDDILIDRNIMRNTWTGWVYSSAMGISIGGGSKTTATVANATITNNFISSTAAGECGIRCTTGNDEGTQPGAVTIAGNTIYGPWVRTGFYHAISINDSHTYKQHNWTIKNNIIANVGNDYKNVGVEYAPTNWVANGNVYDSNNPSFVWDGNNIDSFADWQSVTGQDANSRTGDPLFVDDANGDFHIHANDTLVEGAGVDITDITTVDIDGDARDPNTPWPGADKRQ